MPRLIFVPTADDAPSVQPGDVSVVLDTAWTPTPGARADVVSVRPSYAAAVERADLYAAALATLDRWAEASGIADHVLVDGVTYWFRAREDLWHWAHERLLWLYSLSAIDAAHGVRTVSAPADEEALIDVVRALGRQIEVREAAPLGDPPASASPAAPRPVPQAGPSLPRAILRRVARTIRQPATPPAPRERSERDARVAENERRTAFLDDRFGRLMADPRPRVVVLTLPGSYQRVGGAGTAERRDPNLGSVIPALADAGLAPIVIGLGLGRQRDEDWATTEADDRLLPAFYLQTRWARPEDRERASETRDAVLAGLDAVAGARFDIDGVDLTGPFLAALRRTLERIVEPDVQQLARIERLVHEVRPGAVLMTQEGHRIPWLLAAERAGVPTFALQHGILYPGHAGYANRRHPRLIVPTRTFVFGDYERRVLEGLAYRPEEVAVAGSPRLDLDTIVGATGDGAQRSATRRELGIAPEARVLVISTLHLPFVRRSHLVHMLEVCLGGPLPGVHLVFKQHPGERDEGPYRRLLEGLAEAGGYDPPPISLVKDVDLYRLLRSADAHLGLNSTVLTDAVMAGTDNLIAIVEGHRDLLGYVDAGVARPVHGVADVRAAMRDPRPVDPAARRAFLDDHFRAGDAGGRIAAEIAATVNDRRTVAASPA